MKHLIDRLLKTMRYDDVDEQPIDIIELIQTIIDREQMLYPDITLITSFPQKLVIVTDPTVLESILTNLITNAYKYALPNTALDIQVSTGNMKISNVYDVKQKPDLDLIREPFYRADESRTDGTSHGLGLTIVRQLVDRLGWTVNVQFDADRIVFTLIWSE